MADLITALVLVLGAVLSAEWVRVTCRRRLLTPVIDSRPAATADDTVLKLSQ